MTIKKLAELIAAAEGKKVEVNIGNIREILSILSDMVWAQSPFDYSESICKCLAKNGKRRAKKK